MDFETLKKDNKKKYMIGLIVISAIVVTLTYIGTRAKYRVTSSAQLASGVINYSPSDLELVAIKLQNDSNSYDNSDTVPTIGYTLNTEKSVCKVGETKQAVIITYENGKVGISGITTKGTKCQIYFDKQVVGKDLILSKNTIDTSRSSGYFESAFTDDTAGKIFSAEDDDGTTYFFAGSNPNNWVNFAGFYWRIVRINGDGSIRIIYNGSTTDQTGETTQIGTSAFNECNGDNAHVGYMYGIYTICKNLDPNPGGIILPDEGGDEGDELPLTLKTENINNVKSIYGIQLSTYAETHTNTNSSTVKTYLDNWYTTNLKTNYEQYIDINAGFCGDRTVDNYSSGYTGDGSGTTKTEYAPKKRAYNTYTATYKCSNSNDYYTVSTSSKGNKALENPIGLITSDEVMYAGGYSNAITQNYWLKTGQYYWTMSPNNFNGGYVYIHIVIGDGTLNLYEVANLIGVRPVISLKPDTLTLGSGTTSDPFRIAIRSHQGGSGSN